MYQNYPLALMYWYYSVLNVYVNVGSEAIIFYVIIEYLQKVNICIKEIFLPRYKERDDLNVRKLHK